MGNVPSLWLEEGPDASARWMTHLYPNDCFYVHLSIYDFATAFCRDRVVLDAGSGTGYGTAWLADHGAASAWGIDVSQEGVAFSRQHFQRPNLRYEVLAVQEAPAFFDHQFDVIFSSNVLEHVPNVMAALHAVWQVLKPDGVAIVAVPPITDFMAQADNIANPYHLNIWSPRQWHYVLGEFFGEIDCYSHTLKRPDLVLNLSNTPEQTTIDETAFAFELIPAEQLEVCSTYTSIFVARTPRSAGEVPAVTRSVTFIDDSFTLPDDDPDARGRAAQHLLARMQVARARLARFGVQPDDRLIWDLRSRIHELEAGIVAKNDHIQTLESLLHRIESGRVMRLLSTLSKPRHSLRRLLPRRGR